MLLSLRSLKETHLNYKVLLISLPYIPLAAGSTKIVVSIPSIAFRISFQLISLSGSPVDLVQLQSISVSPDPPKPGQDLTVNVLAEATGVIDVR